MRSVEFAWGFVVSAHGEQEYGGDQPYVRHLERVAEQVPDRLKVAALLHDVVEDTEVTHQDLVRIFGVETANLVDFLTRHDFLTYEEYINRLSLSQDAIVIKLADIADHLYHIEHVYPGQRWDSLKPRYLKAKAYLEQKLKVTP